MKALWGELKIDRNDLHARTLPVYLAIMPVILALAAVLPTGLDLPLAGASAFVFVPLCYAAGQFAADCGKRMEKNLWRRWGGPPTTRFLRHGNGDATDTHWEACTEELIRRTRDRVRFPLVFEGLVQYGYRRNLLGLKRVGLPVSIAALFVCMWRGWAGRLELSTVAVAANRYARYLLEAALDRR